MATIVGTVAASPFVPFEWMTPTSVWHAALFVGMGIMAGTFVLVLRAACLGSGADEPRPSAIGAVTRH